MTGIFSLGLTMTLNTLATGHSPSRIYSGVSGETLTNIGVVHPSGKQIEEVNADLINEGWHIAK